MATKPKYVAPKRPGAAYLLIRHKVSSYRKWRTVFDAHGPTRKARGSRGGRLFRRANDPLDLVIMLRWNDLDRAREFAASDEFRDAMARAGVSDIADVYLLDELGTTAQ